jgi:hypothetical protein
MIPDFHASGNQINASDWRKIPLNLAVNPAKAGVQKVGHDV